MFRNHGTKDNKKTVDLSNQDFFLSREIQLKKKLERIECKKDMYEGLIEENPNHPKIKDSYNTLLYIEEIAKKELTKLKSSV